MQELETLKEAINKWVNIPLAAESNDIDVLLALDEQMNEWFEKLESAFTDVERALEKQRERIAELEEELDEAHHNLELAVDVGNAKAAHAHREER